MSDDLELRRHLRDAVRRNLGPMEESAIFLAIFSRSYEKDSMAVLQFGLAILMDKPVYLVVESGKEIAENVKRLCRGLEYYDPDDQESIKQATVRIMKKAVGDLGKDAQ